MYKEKPKVLRRGDETNKYKEVERLVYYKPFKKEGEEGIYHLGAFVVEDGVLKNTTFFELDNLAKLRGYITAKEKDLVYPHPQEAKALVAEHSANTMSRGADKEIIHPTDIESQDIQFSRTDTEQKSAGGFYSAAAKAIEKMPNKMDSEAFLKYLKNNGVKDVHCRTGSLEMKYSQVTILSSFVRLECFRVRV